MTSLVIFKAITDCVDAFNSVFGKQQKSLRLYNALLEKTSVGHTVVIEKHNTSFRKFCIENKDAILTKNSKSFSVTKIIYSEKVFIDMKGIFEIKGESEHHPMIWQHLLCLLALFDPSSEAKSLLKKELAVSNSRESELLSTLVNSGTGNGNPMEAINNMMSSGILSELIGGLQTGNLDTKKLFGGIRGMMNEMGGSLQGDPQTEKMMSMMSKMMDSLEDGMTTPDDVSREEIVPQVMTLLEEVTSVSKPPPSQEKEENSSTDKDEETK